MFLHLIQPPSSKSHGKKWKRGNIDRRERALPKEVLQLTGTLNHRAANFNQIAKKRNGIDELDAFERAELMVQSGQVKRLAEEIKSHFK